MLHDALSLCFFACYLPHVASSRLASLPVGLRLSIDGYQPFKHTNSNMTPVMMEILNLPAHLRQLIPHQIPIALVPGPKDTASEMYFELLRPIVEELRELFAGVQMPVYVPDVKRIEERSVSAVLIVTSFDTPACRKVRRSRARPSRSHSHSSSYHFSFPRLLRLPTSRTVSRLFVRHEQTHVQQVRVQYLRGARRLLVAAAVRAADGRRAPAVRYCVAED